MIKRFFVLALVFVVLASGGLAGAQDETGGDSHAQGGGDAPRSRRVTVALNGFENNITPFTHTFLSFPNTHDLVNLVYDTLFWSQARRDPEPWLAESAESSPDARVWTVRLRRGVTWHDGRPFTADDVKFSMVYYKLMPQFSGRYAHHVADQPPLDRAEVIDDHTIRLFFAIPTPTFEIMPGGDLPILPRHQWEKVTEPAKFTSELPIGTGPYRLAEIVPDQLYRFEANRGYFKGRPTVDEIRMPIVRDPSAAFASLRTGQVDHVARNVPPELVEQFENQNEIRLIESTKYESVQMHMNARKPPLNNPELRKAISLAVDNGALVRTVLGGHGRPGRDSFTHPDSPWALPNGGHERSAPRAREMLDDAGYADRDGDGVREASDGTRLEFSVLVSSFEPQELRAVQLISQQVAPIGVKLNSEAIDPATLRQRRRPTGDNQPPPYDAYISTLETHAHADPDALYYFFQSPGTKGFGEQITGYSNAEFDRLVQQAAGIEDLNERAQILHRAQRILAEEVPTLTLYYPDGLYAVRPAAYNGWVADPGHGVLHKRSFLPEYAGEGAQGEGVGDAVSGTDRRQLVAGGVVLAIALAALTVWLVRRRRVEAETE